MVLPVAMKHPHQDRAVTLEDFVTMQEHSVRNVTDQLVERTKEVRDEQANIQPSVPCDLL